MIFAFLDMVLHVERNSVLCSPRLTQHQVWNTYKCQHCVKNSAKNVLIFINSFVVVHSVVSDYLWPHGGG